MRRCESCGKRICFFSCKYCCRKCKKKIPLCRTCCIYKENCKEYNP